MKKSGIMGKLSTVAVLLVQSCLLAGFTVFAVLPTGCKLDESPGVIDGDHESPKIEEVTVVDENTVEIGFSESVTVTDGSVTESGVSVDYEMINYLKDKIDISYSKNCSRVIVTFAEGTKTGKNYVFSGNVKDEKGNTLGFSIPFVGYNGNLAKVVMTEIQTETVTSRTAKEKELNYYKTEFVELLALSDGNLSGMELVSVYDGEDEKYVFPNLDVKAGEVFVVHLRNHGDGCANEDGENLALAKAPYSSDMVRDLWSSNESTALGNKTDIVFIRNAADGSIMDGVMYKDKTVTEWKEAYVPYAESLVKAGIFENGSVEAAVSAGEKTNGKTLMRVDAEVLNSKALSGEEISYPVAVTADGWCIGSATCGSVGE